MFFSYEKAVGKIIKCAKLFHTNNYPIIIIETENLGGDPALAYLQIQLFQMREVERTYSAMRYSELNKKYYKVEDFYGPDFIFEPDTCKAINLFEEFTETIDFYNHSWLNITHKIANAFVEIYTLNIRKAFNKFRKKYQNSAYLKRPTNIIVFTDDYSFNSGSIFIKGLQNIWGAIIIGYLGNPKIKGTDSFDGSQSDSASNNYVNTEIYNNLAEQGFFLASLVFIEVFNDDFKRRNPILGEYTMIRIDIRVENYYVYSDEIYNEFIEEGKKYIKNIMKKTIAILKIKNYCYM